MSKDSTPPPAEERDGTLGEVIDRRVQVYGDPVASFAEIATMWSVLFDVEVPAWKVPIAQTLMKVVRMKTSPDYSDHSDDIDGYLDIFRKIIGPDMIHARTVNEYIEKKWGDGDPDRTRDLDGEPIPFVPMEPPHRYVHKGGLADGRDRVCRWSDKHNEWVFDYPGTGEVTSCDLEHRA